MRLQVTTKGLAELITSFNGARPRIQAVWLKGANELGHNAIEYLRRTYRSGPTTDSKRTAIRTGLLRRSYTHEAKPDSGGVTLTLGFIRPDKKVLIYGPVQEFGATIAAKRAAFLQFPIRGGSGLAKANILGWARVKSVTIPARPALAPTVDVLLPLLQKRAADDLRKAIAA